MKTEDRPFDYLVGETFGHLKVVERAGTVIATNGKKALWRCVCSCGNEIKRTTWQLRRSLKTGGEYISCGCQKSALSRANGLKNAGRSKPGSAKAYVLRQYKSRAKRRKIKWSLTDEEFFSIILSPCFYTGWGPSNTYTTKSGKETIEYNGIDRINSRKGYIRSNCVPCHRVVNQMKSDASYEEFMMVVQRLAKREQSVRKKIQEGIGA